MRKELVLKNEIVCEPTCLVVDHYGSPLIFDTPLIPLHVVHKPFPLCVEQCKASEIALLFQRGDELHGARSIPHLAQAIHHNRFTNTDIILEGGNSLRPFDVCCDEQSRSTTAIPSPLT